MRINHNLAALNSYRQLSTNSSNQSRSLEKLSSGQRINRAGDDAAGLAISEKMRGQIRGLDQASRNAQDGISLIQTAEGALNETHSMLQRMRELAVQANNDTNTSADRTAIQSEIDQLNTEITSIASRTTFNTKNLLDGSLGVKAYSASSGSTILLAAGVTINLNGVKNTDTISLAAGATSITASLNGVSQTIDVTTTSAATGTVNFDKIGLSLTISGTQALSTINGTEISAVGSQADFQIDANYSSGVSTLSISINDMKATSLGSTALGGVGNVNSVDVTTQTFQANIATIDQAIADVSTQRASLGAWQNRLDHTIANLGTSSENLTAAESRVRDVDMAKEMMEFTKNNILAQASTAMLAQANQQPQGVLQLLS